MYMHYATFKYVHWQVIVYAVRVCTSAHTHVQNKLPVLGTCTSSGSGRVTKGNVAGLLETVLSKRMRFMALVKSRPTSRDKASVCPSNLYTRVCSCVCLFVCACVCLCAYMYICACMHECVSMGMHKEVYMN